MKIKIRKNSRVISIMVLAAGFMASASAQSAWTQFELNNLNGWSGASLGHLATGQLLYGENGHLYLQDSWGSSSFTPFSNAGDISFDPSFIAAGPSAKAVLGEGGYGEGSRIYSIDDPSGIGSTFSTSVASVLNYDGLFRDSSSLFVAGSSDSVGNSLRHVALDGSFDNLLVENISQYGSGIASDADGNLYVGDGDDGAVYRFAKSLLDQAIVGGDILTVDSAGVEHLCTFENSLGSLAVDANGVIWSAGWDAAGISYFDNGSYGSMIPGAENNNYKIGTFSRNGESYLAYLNNEGWSAGSALTYGYANVDAVPEPHTAFMMIFGLSAILMRRIKSILENHVQ